MMCGKNIIRLWLNVLLELMLIHYYFFYVVIYNCTRMYASVGNMLLYIMYQSFYTVSGCFDFFKRRYYLLCVVRTISNTPFWKFVLYPECMYSVCCVLFAVCCLLFAVCCLLFAVCCLLFAVCCVLV